MFKKLTLYDLCCYVCRQVPEAELAEVRSYVIFNFIQPYDLSTVYKCAHNIEKQLINEGRI